MKRLAVVALFVLSLAFVQTSALAAPAPGRTNSTFGSSAAVGAARAGEPQSVGVLVRFKDPASAPLAARLLSAVTSSSAAPTDRTRGLFAFRTPSTESAELYSAKLMIESSAVAYAEPNYVRHIEAYTPPTDPDFTNSATWNDGSGYYLGAKHWWLDAMTAPSAWSVGQGTTYPVRASASDMKVAVLDTGIYLNHAEYNLGTVVGGVDECASYDPNTGIFATDSDITPDANSDLSFASHGTGTSAAVGAEMNGTGMVGIGWNANVIGYKVAGPLTAPWSGYPAGTIVILDGAVAQGIYDAVNSGCKVINMSLGGTGFSQTYQDAITYAHNHGVVVLASAGNEGNATVNYPAACTYCTAVAAVARSGGNPTTNGAITPASFSDYGPGVNDLTAPGQMFWTADKPGYVGSSGVAGYQFWAGTSFSSPAAAGAIAYLWRAMPDLSSDQIVSYVESSAVDLGTPGRDDNNGYGLVDMRATYDRMIADYPMLATPTVAASYVRPSANVTWTPSAGYNVNYLVSVDGTLRSTQTSAAYALPGLADGTHIVSVLPTSTRNWNTTSLGSRTITVDSVAPVASGFGLAGSTLSWTVAEANPYSVQAYVDTATPSAVATNSLAISGLAAGLHTLHVNATDAAGNSSGWVTWQFSSGGIALAAPVVPSVVVTDALSATLVWPAIGGATSYDYTIDGGSVLSTGGPGFVLTGLTGGLTQIAVRSVAGTLTSSWATATLTDSVVVPATPSISTPANVATPSVTATWPVAANARSYEYRLNGGSASPTAGLSATFPLALGASTISVRSLNNLSASAWATVTVTYAVAVPVISAPATVWASTATVSWNPVPGATAYEYAVNGGAPISTAATGAVASGLSFGTNTVTVRTVRGSDRSDWATASVTYAAPAATTLSLSPGSATVQDPASSTTLTASISAPAETFRLQSSPDGSAWADTGITRTSAAPPTPIAISVPVTATTSFRLVFDGDAHWAAATSNVATVTYVSLVETPTLASFTVTDTLFATVTWPSITGAAAYDYSVNGGSVLSTSGPAFGVAGLSVGPNTIQVRTVDAKGKTSGWATCTVTVALLVPAPPVLSMPASVALPVAAASWAPVAGALAYEYRLDGGVVSATVATGVVLPLSASGTHSIEVRSLDNLSRSTWATASVVYQVPAPVLSAPATVSATTATVSWAPINGATGYEYTVNGGSLTPTTATSFDLTALAYGDTTVTVRALQGGNASAWAIVTVSRLAFGVPAISLVSASPQLPYPASSVTLVGQFGAPGEHVVLQSSVNGGLTWSDTGSGWVATSTASTSVTLGISRSTSYRLVFAGDQTWAPAISSIVPVAYVPRLQKPSAPAKVTHGHRFTASVVLSAPSANRASTVTFKFRRWMKVGGRYVWITWKSVSVKGTVTGSTTMSYRAALSLRNTGAWSVVAIYSGAPLYGNATSAVRSFRVK